MKNRSLAARTAFALAGWRTALQREKSFRSQMAMTVFAIFLLVMLRPAAIWWAVVGVTCALVLAVELLNSAIEALADMLHPAVHPEIKAIKDMASGAVFAVSMAALVVGIALLVTAGPAFVERWQ